MINILSIDKEEACRYLGYKGQPSEQVLNALIESEQRLLSVIAPRYIYSSFDINRVEKGVKLRGTGLVLTGKDILKHLEGSQKAVILSATIGANVDAVLRAAEISDIASAVMMDALASSAIEQVVDKVEEKIKDEFYKYKLTSRFSPGYGDLPLNIQEKLLDVLNAPKRIGLCVNDKNMLTPIKSVTAVMGLYLGETKEGSSPCERCNLAGNCPYRKRGEYCGI
ncbi:MAG: methionine synthase [Eubacteriales bacterium]